MPTRSGALIVLMVILGFVIMSNEVLADVLVTKSGTRWKGKVTAEGDHYLIQKANGSKVTIPKSVVEEVITAEEAKKQLDLKLETADLADDQQVEKLLAFLTDNELQEERGRILVPAYEKRFKAAKGNVDRLEVLVKWCLKYKLSTQGSACQTAIWHCEFPVRLKAAGSNARMLAELSVWAGERLMKEEAEAAEAKAMAFGGKDDLVRQRLGYVRDESGRWSKETFKAQGYSVTTRLLSESLTGVPEPFVRLKDNRKRFMVIQGSIPTVRLVRSRVDLPAGSIEELQKMKGQRGCIAPEFRLLLQDGTEYEASLVAFLSLFNNEKVDSIPMYGRNPLQITDPSLTPDPSLLAIAFILDEEACKPPFRIRFRSDKAADVPSRMLQIPGCVSTKSGSTPTPKAAGR